MSLSPVARSSSSGVDQRDPCDQILSRRHSLTASNLPFDRSSSTLRMLALQRRPLLCGHHGAERIGREIAERAARPVHVLHRPVGEIVFGGEAKIFAHLGVPGVGDVG